MLLFWALVSFQMFSCTLNPSLRSWETKYLKMTDFRMNRSSCWLFWQKTCVQPTQRIAHGEDYEVRGGWRRVVFVCAVFILVASLPLSHRHTRTFVFHLVDDRRHAAHSRLHHYPPRHLRLLLCVTLPTNTHSEMHRTHTIYRDTCRQCSPLFLVLFTVMSAHNGTPVKPAGRWYRNV